MNNQRQHIWLCLPLSMLMTSGAWSAAWAKPDYYTLKAHGKPIGQVSIEHYPIGAVQAGQQAGTITEIHNTNHATREGAPFALNEVSRFVENPQNGQPLSFSYAYTLGDQHLMAAQGQLQGNALELSLQRENTISQGETPIAPERFLFPAGEGMHQIYRQHFQDPPGSRFQFQTLTLGIQPQLVNSEVIPGKREQLKLDNGERQTVRQFEVKNPADPKTSVHEWRDAQGKLYKATSSGTDELELVLAAVGDEARLDRLDVIDSSAVLSNKISQPRITTEALYRLSPIHGQSIDWRIAVPQGNRQSLQKLTDNQLYLKVFQQEPKDSSVEYPMDSPAKYLQSTPFVQSTDPEIDRVALDTVGQEKRAYFAARMLQRWVYENIAQKDLTLGFASAKETLMNREGDCTEHAVLLTALTRALGIPSRVAVGLIYLPNGDSQAGRFVYHMWTEIYLGNRDQGEWVPLDATRPEPLTDATHIKLADSALNDASELVSMTQRVTDVMGRMKIDVLKAVSLSESIVNMDAAPDITATALQKIDIQEIDVQTLSTQAIKHFRVELPPAAMSKETPDGLFTYGVEALSQGRFVQAQDYFQQAIHKQRNPIGLYRLGEQLAGIEMYNLAQQAMQRAAEKNPDLAAFSRAWTVGLIPQNLLPDDINQQFMQAISEPGKPENSVLLQAVIAAAPDFAPAYRHLGEESSGPEAIDALQRAVSLAPNDFRNAESLGDALMRQKKYQAALQAYRVATETLKRNAAFLQGKPDWLTNLEGKQDLTKANQILAGNKRNASGWLLAGKGLLLQKRRDEAVKAFANALSLNPDSTEARLLSFQMALQNSDWRTIDAHKSTVAALAGGNAQAASLLGLYQMRSRQYGPAISSLQHAIAMAPRQGEPYRTLAQTYLRLADLADDQAGPKGRARSKQLITQAQNTLRQGSNHASPSNERHALSVQLANLLVKTGNPSDALALADTVLASNPLNGSAWAAKGKAQYFLGQYPQAHATLTTALSLNPNDSEILTQLGHVAKEQELDGQALEYYQKAYKADPFNPEASNSVRAMMNQLRIAGHQPPNYWFLSDDEHDYLVQLLYQGKALSNQTLNYLRTLQAIPGRAGKVTFSASGVVAGQQLHTTLQKFRQETLQLSKTVQTIQAPVRLAPLKRELLAAVKQQVLALDLGLNYASQLDYSAFSISASAYTHMLVSVPLSQKSMQSLLNQLNDHLPDPIMDGLISEAQAEDLDRINQQSASILKALAARAGTNARPTATVSVPKLPTASEVTSMMPGIPGLPAKSPLQTPQIKGNNTGVLPPGISPNGIQNISLPPGLTPEAIKTFTKPATQP